jgi:integrase
MHFLTREQALVYLDSCDAWYRPLAEILVGAGLWIGEAIALGWPDVDWDGSALEVSRSAKDSDIVGTPKGHRLRTVLPAPYLLDVLRDHRKGQASAGRLDKLVFRSPEGFMLTATTSVGAATTTR